MQVKFVVIRDKRAVAVKYFVVLAVLAYAIHQMFGPRRAYMAKEAPLGYFNTWAEGWDPTQVPDGLCDGSEEWDFRYDDYWVYRNNRCRVFSRGEVLRKLESGAGVYVQTYVQHSSVNASGCRDDGSSCAETTRTTRNYFVPGVDDITLGIDHGFRTNSLRTVRNPETTLLDADGAELRRFGPGPPVLTSLGELLRAAGVDSLDAENHAGRVNASIGTPKYRMTGLRLQIIISYSNLHTLGGAEVVATMRALAGSTGWNGMGGEVDYVSSAGGPPGENYTVELHDRYSYGVLIKLSAQGQIGEPDLLTFFIAFASVLVYLSIAQVCADIVAEFLLGDLSEKIKRTKNQLIAESGSARSTSRVTDVLSERHSVCAVAHDPGVDEPRAQPRLQGIGPTPRTSKASRAQSDDQLFRKGSVAGGCDDEHGAALRAGAGSWGRARMQAPDCGLVGVAPPAAALDGAERVRTGGGAAHDLQHRPSLDDGAYRHDSVMDLESTGSMPADSDTGGDEADGTSRTALSGVGTAHRQERHLRSDPPVALWTPRSAAECAPTGLDA